MDQLYRAGRLIRTVVLALKIEPFIFLFVLSTSLSEITTTQLIQDKICLNKYNKSIEYCIGISELKIESNGDNTKSLILAELAQFSIYSTIIASIPAIFYVLFIGSWTDNYIHGRKCALLLGTFGYIGSFAGLLTNAINFDFEVHYILLAYIFSALTGGWSCIWLTSYSYMSNNSSTKYRFIKFTAFEVSVNAAGPLGTYLGGQLLGSGNSNPNDKQIHNYERVFIASLISSTIGFIWVLISINENKSKQSDENSNLINSFENETQSLTNSNANQTHVRRIDKKFKFSMMFDIENLKDVIKTAVKVRPNKGKAQIWLLYLSMCVLMLSDVRNFVILFPYVEQVYGWDAKQFSQIKSIASIIQITSMTLIVTTLSGILKVSDTKLGIIGFSSTLFAALILGSVINPLGLYLMYLIGSTSGISSVAIRSLLSKIASDRESGKVFSLLAALETVVPPINVLIYNTLFEYTIDFYPSLPFQIAGALMYIPILIFIWIDLTRIQFYSVFAIN